MAEDSLKEKNADCQKEKNIQCDECYLKTTSESQLETHKRLKHIDVVKFNCKKCAYNSSTSEKLAEHEQNNHQEEEERNLKCNKCDYRANVQKDVDTHEWITNINNYRCDKCEFTTDKAEVLETHVQSTHWYKFNLCDHKDNNKSDLDVHKQGHLDITFKCVICEIVTKSRKAHVEVSHGKPNCNDKCKEFETLQTNYQMLKENYERLININKKLQAQNKDKDMAVDIQLEELRSGYERVKAENIKLNSI